jgi:hypothetical protein
MARHVSLQVSHGKDTMEFISKYRPSVHLEQVYARYCRWSELHQAIQALFLGCIPRSFTSAKSVPTDAQQGCGW